MTTLQPLNQKHFFSQHTISSFAFILFLLLAFIIFSRIPFNEPLTVKRFIAKQQRLTTVSNSTQLTCSPNTQSQENACAYVEEMILKGICPESPYLRLLYCHLTYSHPVFYILMVIWLSMMFYILVSTSKNYFCPSLSKISNYLRLTPNIAGVTLLALGNGAPDLSSLTVGLFSGNSSIGLGAPTGAGVYVTTVVLGLVTLVSDFQVTRRPFIRDCGYFLCALIFLFIAFITNKVMLWQSLMCLIFYAIYVAIVVGGRTIRQYRKKKKEVIDKIPIGEETALLKKAEGDTEEAGSVKIYNNSAIFIPKMGIITNPRDPSDKNVPIQYPETQDSLVIDEYFTAKEEIPEDDKIENITKKNILHRLWASFVREIGWKEKKWYQKVFFIIFEATWVFLRNISIFRSDEKRWNKWFAAAVPIFAPVLILIALNPNYVFFLVGGYIPLATIVMAGGSLFSILILLTTKRTKPPFYQPILVFAGFVMSITWIFVIASQLVKLLETFGIIWGIPSSILAITILAWGTSMGDTISNVMISKKGYPAMAIGACLGGPLLNLLIGLGLALTFNPIQLKNLCYPLAADPTVAISFIFLIISLTSSLIVIPACKFKPRKPYGIILIIWYLLYLVVCVTAALYKPFGQLFTWNVSGC